MLELETLKNKFNRISDKDMVEFIEYCCDNDYDMVTKQFEENKATFGPIMIKWGMVRKRPEYKDLFDKYTKTFIFERDKRKKEAQEKKDQHIIKTLERDKHLYFIVRENFFVSGEQQIVIAQIEKIKDKIKYSYTQVFSTTTMITWCLKNLSRIDDM